MVLKFARSNKTLAIYTIYKYIQLAREIRVYKHVSMPNIFVRNTRMPIEWLPWQRYQHQRLDARNGSFCHHIRQSSVGSSHIWKHFRRLVATIVQMSWKKTIGSNWRFWGKKKRKQIFVSMNTNGTEPVKLMPARCGEAVIVSPNTGPSAGMKLTTPAGTPASRIILKMTQFDRTAVSDGFHSTEFPCKNKWKN